jgi:hypothetical protein
MAKYEFDKEKFEEWKRLQKESLELQEKMNSSIGGYLESVKKIKELQKNIQFIEQKVAQLKEEQVKAEQDLLKNTEKLNKATADGDADEIKALKEKEKELKKILAAKKEGVAITEREVSLLKKQNEALVESAKQANLMSAGLGSAVGFLAKTPGLISKGFGMLKATGIFEMDKEIRNAVRSMAGGQKEYNNMFNTITKAAETTTMWGVGVKDLAIMQRGYTEAIGRSVMLTEKGYKAMAGMAEGTGLGKEFAVAMAGEMDKFNISAEMSGTIVENTMNKAAKLGVNGAAALKSLQNNLKLAQRFNFKGGIAGLAKFSVEVTKLKLDMEGIAGMAEKVFRPEGAIEMAAELTTLGGKFAALGDPMQLMFKARNDPEQFAKDIGKASAEFGEFNKETGVFQLKGGLALDRMREISRITGISVEKLQEMAEAQARVEEIGKTVKSGMFNKEDTDLISSMAKFDKDKGWVINIKGQDKLVKDLRQTDMKNIRAEEMTLEKRAEEARTFDETLTDLILQFKQLLLPFAKDLKQYLGGPIQELSKKWTAEGFYETLRGFVQGVSDLIPAIMSFVKDNPITSAIAVGGALFGGILFEGAKWIANGLALAAGFMMGTGGLGGGGMPGGGGGLGAKIFNTSRRGAGMSRMGQMGMNFKGASKSFGAGAAGLMAAGFAGYDEYSENAAMGMGGAENAGRTTSKAAGAGLGAWGGAAAGAAIGSVVPVVGTLIGGLIGGVVGSFAGSEVGESLGDAIWGDERAGRSSGNVSRINDGVMFHPQDKFLKVNDAVQIAGTSVNGNAKLAQELSKNNASAPGEMTHKFEDLKITIDVNIPGNEKLGSQLANTPEFIRRINEAINKEIAMAAGGGKLSGSGTKRSGK